MKTTEQQRENIKNGSQGTQEPWKRPGRASQEPSDPVPSKEDRDYSYEQDNKTS